MVGSKPDPQSIYMPRPHGFEIKAFAAWTIGVAPLLPGLAYSFTTASDKGAVAAKHMYST